MILARLLSAGSAAVGNAASESKSRLRASDSRPLLPSHPVLIALEVRGLWPLPALGSVGLASGCSSSRSDP